VHLPRARESRPRVAGPGAGFFPVSGLGIVFRLASMPVLRSNCGISAGSHRKGGSRDGHRWPRNVIPVRQVRCSSSRATQHTSLGGANPATPVVQQVYLRFRTCPSAGLVVPAAWTHLLSGGCYFRLSVRRRGRVSSGQIFLSICGEPAGVRRKDRHRPKNRERSGFLTSKGQVVVVCADDFYRANDEVSNAREQLQRTFGVAIGVWRCLCSAG
jgi:hypothetical protein